MIREQFPSMPAFTLKEIREAKASEDAMPLLFEWYKYVGLCVNYFASIRYEPFYLRDIPHLHYAVFIGQLNRISKLMVSNVRLGSEGSHGEAICILSRCMFESTVTLRYLCSNYSPSLIKMFLADSVKKDIELKGEIIKNISSRNGKPVEIENRMLRSIQNTVETTGMSESQILGQKKWPDLKTICNKIGLSDDAYVSLQKMGSHAVHGSWTDLVVHQLEKEGDHWVPKDLASAHVNSFGIFPLLVIDALFDYINFLFKQGDLLEEATEFLEEMKSKVQEYYSFGFGNDFETS